MSIVLVFAIIKILTKSGNVAAKRKFTYHVIKQKLIKTNKIKALSIKTVTKQQSQIDILYSNKKNS